jgi:hypothetical protein
MQWRSGRKSPPIPLGDEDVAHRWPIQDACTAMAGTVFDPFVLTPRPQVRLRRRSPASTSNGNRQAGAKAPPLLLLLLTLRPFAAMIDNGAAGGSERVVPTVDVSGTPISVKPLDSDWVAKIWGAAVAAPLPPDGGTG